MHEVNARALDYGAFTLNSIGRESLQPVPGKSALGFLVPRTDQPRNSGADQCVSQAYRGFSGIGKMDLADHCLPRSNREGEFLPAACEAIAAHRDSDAEPIPVVRRGTRDRGPLLPGRTSNSKSQAQWRGLGLTGTSTSGVPVRRFRAHRNLEVAVGPDKHPPPGPAQFHCRCRWCTTVQFPCSSNR